jgi:hypothetical protein
MYGFFMIPFSRVPCPFSLLYSERDGKSQTAISTSSVHNLVEKSPSYGVNSLIQLRSWRIAQGLGVFQEENPHPDANGRASA